MPMTPNSKIDRKALPASPTHDDSLSDDPPPTTDLERELVAIWEDLLQRSPVGVRSDFFDLGGDSLALLSLFATIEARFGRRLTVDVLGRWPDYSWPGAPPDAPRTGRYGIDAGCSASAIRRSSAILLRSRHWWRCAAPASSCYAYGHQAPSLRSSPSATRPPDRVDYPNRRALRRGNARSSTQRTILSWWPFLWGDDRLRDGIATVGTRA